MNSDDVVTTTTTNSNDGIDTTLTNSEEDTEFELIDYKYRLGSNRAVYTTRTNR